MNNTPETEVSDQLEVTINWHSKLELLPGRPYNFKYDGQIVKTTFTKLKNRISKANKEKQAANTLKQGELGTANISLEKPVHFFTGENKEKISTFEILDVVSDEILGSGTINFGLRRATNIQWQALDITKASRASMKHQIPRVVWLTGLSGSGKSTIANLVEKKLFDMQKHSYVLDGDNVRHGLNKDLGFTDADRVENIRRISETAKLMLDAGLIVLTSFISPFRSERLMARQLLEEGEFVEVFVDTPIELCEQRDPKGLYKKVRKGLIKNFTGFDSPYETPENPEIVIKTAELSAEEAATKIVDYLSQ